MRDALMFGDALLKLVEGRILSQPPLLNQYKVSAMKITYFYPFEEKLRNELPPNK